jgi:hypothetical protein
MREPVAVLMAAVAGIEVRLNGIRQLCISILDEGRF